MMEMIGNLISAHPYLTLGIFVGYWLLSNIVAAMPSPDQASGKGYKFAFSLAHSLVGSIPRILPSLRLPGDPTRGTQTFFGNGGAPPAPQTPPPAPPGANS